jgi:hypothetical protein
MANQGMLHFIKHKSKTANPTKAPIFAVQNTDDYIIHSANFMLEGRRYMGRLGFGQVSRNSGGMCRLYLPYVLCGTGSRGTARGATGILILEWTSSACNTCSILNKQAQIAIVI